MTPPFHRRPAAFRVCLFYGVLALAAPALLPVLAAPAAAAEAGKRRFDIPADVAERSLKTFGAQAGAQVIFGTETASRIRTNAVRGELAPEEALNRLVAGTGLVVERDATSGAFMVNATSPNDRGVEPVTRSLRPEVPAVPATRDEEQPITLSAFTISSNRDVGYTATNTLAGTRLNTSLKDVGTAISVVTKELLNDIGANDAGTLLNYTVSTEVGGLDGNFAGGTFNGSRANQDSARAEPERNQRVRGLASAELTRDYFLTDVPFDSYNTERVTLNRGPNALLFGIGSPGGIIDNTTIAPLFGTDFYEARVQVGSHDSHRESVDLNRVLIPNRVAVRLAALNEDTKYRQRPAYQVDRRIFGALNAVLLENKNSPILDRTTLRANAEYGDIDGTPPNVIPPNDAFSSWFELPPASYQSYTGTTFPAFFRNGSWRPNATVDNIANSVPGTASTVAAAPYFQQLGVWYLPGETSPRGSLGNLDGGQGRILYPGRPFVGVVSSAHAFTRPYFIGFTAPTINNRQNFDSYNHLYSGGMTWSDRDFKTGTVTLEQSLLRGRAGLELAYDHQTYHRHTGLPFSGGQSDNNGDADIYLSIGRFMANEQPDPHLGRPYMRIIGYGDTDLRTLRQSGRATAFAKLEGKDQFGEGSRGAFWFGRHVLTGLYSEQTIKSTSRTYRHAWDSDTVSFAALGFPRIENTNRQIVPVVYMGPSYLNAATAADVRLQPASAVLPRDGERYRMFYYDSPSRTVRNGEFYVRRYLNGGNIERSEIESSAVSLQSHLLADHLVGLVGFRTDEQSNFERVNLDNDTDPLSFDRLPSGEFDARAIRLREQPSNVTSGDTFTWSVVAQYPERWLGRLPLGAELRAFFNKSENFNPVGARRSVFNELLPDPEGKTEERGLMLDLFEGKISARINFFKTTGDNFTYSALNGSVNGAIAGAFTGMLNRLIENERQGVSLQTYGYTAQGYTSWEQVRNDVLKFLPEPTRSATNLRIQTVNGVPVVFSDPIVGAAATSSFKAEGWELDLTGNPVGGLRIFFNVSKQETVQTNIARDLAKLAEQTLANIDASPLRTLYDQPTVTPITFRERYTTIVTLPLLTELAKEGTASLEQREWRANTAVSYRFSQGLLRGFGLGVGLRWQSKAAIGYSTLLNAGNLPIPDLSRPYYGDAEFNGDTWLSYERPLFNRKLRWKIQLNVRNAVGTDQFIPVAANPDGSIAIARVPPPTEWFLTNTFRF